jgi:phage FluMu protein Com
MIVVEKAEGVSMQYRCPKCKAVFEQRTNAVIESISIPGAMISGGIDLKCPKCGASVPLGAALPVDLDPFTAVLDDQERSKKSWWQFWK